LNTALEKFREKRNLRGVEMLNKLKDLGIDLSYDYVKELAGRSAIGRPNVAEALFRTKAVKSYQKAFDKYIGFNRPAYVPKANMTPKEAMGLIHRAHGLAVLAHPGIANVGRYIDEFLTYGLDGIEVYHPNHNRSLQKTYLELTIKKSILATGGSDYHGREGRYGEIGSQPVPSETVDALKNRLKYKN